MKSVIILALLAVIAVILYFTNPDSTDFRNFVKAYIENEFSSDSESDQTLLSLASGPLADVVEASTTRTNFGVGSVYEFEIGDRTYKFLGIASKFFPLQEKGPIADAKELLTP